MDERGTRVQVGNTSSPAAQQVLATHCGHLPGELFGWLLSHCREVARLQRNSFLAVDFEGPGRKEDVMRLRCHDVLPQQLWCLGSSRS